VQKTVGARLSPFSTLRHLKPYSSEEVHETYVHLAKALDEIGIASLHIGIGGPVPHELLNDIRASFAGTIILCNGLTPESAEAVLHENFADLVAFSRAFIQFVS
jgi:N-ethylmaleimide reductase